MAKLRKLRCPECKTLRYTTSQETEYQCVACGARLRIKVSAPTKRAQKSRLAQALGVDQ